MLFDSHAHINNDSYTDEEREELIKEIENSDLGYVMDIGFDLESSLRATEHAKRFSWCYAAVGIHPHDAKSMDEDVLTMIKGLAKKDKVQAIGEIGLDFHYNNSEPDVQEYWFPPADTPGQRAEAADSDPFKRRRSAHHGYT